MDPLVKVNVGFSPNDGTGDALRNAFIKLNQNVDSIANAIGAPFGLASLGVDGRLLLGQLPVPLALPTTLHDLDNYVSPGVYRQTTTAGAQAGAHYPIVLPGILEVIGSANGVVAVQRYTVTSPGTDNNRRFFRAMTSGAWSGWGDSVSTALIGVANGIPQLDANVRLPAGQLPAVTQSLWNGTTLNLSGTGSGAIITGEFPGMHSTTSVRFKASAAGGATSTYVQAVPAAPGGTSGFLARENETTNASFVTLANDTTNNVARILFSRHGTGSLLSRLVFQSADQECGSVSRLGEWQLGAPPPVRAANTAITCTYAGGTTLWGILMAPKTLNDGAAVAFQNVAGGLVGSITTSATGTSYNVSSDYRLKRLKGDSDKEAGRVRIMGVRVRDFTWKANDQDDTGVLAHELAETHPRAVNGEKDAVMEMAGFEGMILPQSVDFSKLVPDLILTAQRQQQIIDQMRAELDELKSSGLASAPAQDPAN